jgi:trans-2,3-dihydro-3-hydroxyanthranilate isomerase
MRATEGGRQVQLGFSHVDVFSASPLGGNGLGVVLSDRPLDARLMLEITRELRQFETIFLDRVDDGGADARVFTPDGPLEFAGHPVLGAAAVLHWERRPAAADALWQIRLGGRPLTVRTARAADTEAVLAEMNQGPARFGQVLSPSQRDALATSFGLLPRDLRDDLPAQVVSTGLPYLILPLTADALARARVRDPLLPDRLGTYGARFAYLLDPDPPEGRSWDDASAVEDVATGSAAGPVTAYLIEHGGRPPDDQLAISQGRFVGRASAMHTHRDADGSLWVGGPVSLFGRGVLHLRT